MKRPSGRLGVGLFLFFSAVLMLILAVALNRSRSGLRAGQPAPDFELETFEGERLALAELRGQVVVINFWASWCVPCAAEADELQAIWEDYRDRGLVMLGVDYTDTRPEALAYLLRHGVTYPNGMDRADRISRAYRIDGVPETFVVDPLGNLVGLPIAGAGDSPRIVGPLGDASGMSESAFRTVLESLLPASESSTWHHSPQRQAMISMPWSQVQAGLR